MCFVCGLKMGRFNTLVSDTVNRELHFKLISKRIWTEKRFIIIKHRRYTSKTILAIHITYAGVYKLYTPTINHDVQYKEKKLL